MATVKVAKPPSKQNALRELYATVCYYYPQYKLIEVPQIPARDLHLLIKTAQKMEAIKMYNLVQIAAAPHTKKGQAVKKLSDHFKRLSNG